MSLDPAAFREFEFDGWQKVANRYHDTFAGVTVQSIPSLLNAVLPARGMHILDLACGPGYAAAAASSRGADVLGVDFSSAMIAEASRLHPEVRFQEGDAEALALQNESFDAAMMNFGLLHLGRPDRAISEVWRILRRDGRFAFTVWDTPDKTAGFGIVLAAIRNHGDMNVPIPPGPPFFRFSDPEESSSVLRTAGFRNVEVQKIPQTWRLPTADTLFDIMMNASVRNAALLRAQRPEAIAAIQLEMREALELYKVSGLFELPMPAVLFSAQK